MQRSSTAFTYISIALIAALFFSFQKYTSEKDGRPKAKNSPKIVNIVNFIRLLEPRDPLITQDVLYQTVVKQVEVMQKNRLGGTFLLQYDALIDVRYQKLLKALPKGTFEIGGWWEIPQPLVEKAGLKWRGRYPWDWHADVGFSTGYTPEEREKLIDVYMADFKQIFGYYPKSVASWFIDAHSLNYMYDKYKIVASANCKDQYGTDGYTLWGGYWNQAYYPSRINSYMPAQTVANQLPVPIFRMLGSDPIRQYDTGLGNSRQGVITLEPVYPEAGGSATWVNWFFKELIEGEAMAFNYTQAGQENSFPWNGMSKGFEMQIPLIAKLRDEGKLRVETLEASGLWFKKNFKLTPATSFTATDDLHGGNLPGKNLKTVWFNSRFFRTNMLWEDGALRIRDIHMFDEQLPSVYTTQKATSNECQFFTLPVVDGYLWSKNDDLAGLRLKAIVDGKEVLVKGGTPVITSPAEGKLHITWPLTNIKGTLVVDFSETQMAVSLKDGQGAKWFFDLNVAKSENLPFKNVGAAEVKCAFEGLDYAIPAIAGAFSKPGDKQVFRISPKGDEVRLDLSNGKGMK